MLYLTNINLNQNELQNAIIQPLPSAPSDPKLGQIYTDSTTSKIKWYNGEQWKTVGVVVEESQANGSITVDGVEMNVYTLPIMSSTTLGGAKLGAGLSISEDGTLSVAAGGVADSVNWEGVVGRPTGLSGFENDKGFIDNTALEPYYTKEEIGDIVGNLTGFRAEVVESLPVTGEEGILYLTPSGDGSTYEEYLWVGGTFELIGSSNIDLTDYVTKDKIEEIENKFNITSLPDNTTTNDLNKALSTMGKYTPIVVSEVIPSDETSCQIPLGTHHFASLEAYDSQTGDVVLVDYKVGPSNIECSISKPYENGVEVRVTLVKYSPELEDLTKWGDNL